LKRDQVAIEILESLSALDDRPELVATLLGYGYERTGRLEDALKAYEKVPTEFRLAREVALRRSLILKKMGKSEDARKIVAAEIQRSDAGWQFFVLAAEFAQESGEMVEALEFLQSGIKKYPDNGRLLFLEGAYLEKMERYQDSITAMRKLVKMEPENSSALNFLGYLLVEHGGNLKEARSFIERALKVRPDDGAYLDSLGWCLFKMGEVDKAEGILTQALEKSPKEGVIMEHLAEVAIKKKQNEKALQLLERALQQELDPRDKKRIQRRFDGLKSSS
jgi:tetratricopeptide (TPR) repeat protein